MSLKDSNSEALHKILAKADCRLMMRSTRKASRQALADFFSDYNPQWGHWYTIILSSNKGSTDELLCKAFPPLGKVASVGEDTMREVLLYCSLIQFCRGSGHSVLLQQWENFIMEYQLMEIEGTHFTITKKRRIYMRLGSWNAISHK